MVLRRSLAAAAVTAGAGFLSMPVLARLPTPPRAQSSAPRSQSWVTPGPPMPVQDLLLQVGRFSAETSDRAKARAASAELRHFAELEREEQAAFLRALELLGARTALADPLPPDRIEVLRRMDAAEGAELDRIYFRAQVVAHYELLQLHAAGSQGARTPEERAISTLAFAAIRIHMAMLHALEPEMAG